MAFDCETVMLSNLSFLLGGVTIVDASALLELSDFADCDTCIHTQNNRLTGIFKTANLVICIKCANCQRRSKVKSREKSAIDTLDFCIDNVNKMCRSVSGLVATELFKTLQCTYM